VYDTAFASCPFNVKSNFDRMASLPHDLVLVGNASYSRRSVTRHWFVCGDQTRAFGIELYSLQMFKYMKKRDDSKQMLAKDNKLATLYEWPSPSLLFVEGAVSVI
jgi:hypothetical protein